MRFYLYCFIILFSFQIDAKDWEHIFDRSQYQNVKISPDGKHLALAALVNKKTALIFLDSDTLKTVGSASFKGKQEVGDFYWINDERVVIKVVEKSAYKEQPDFYGELFAVNYDGSKGKAIYGYRAGEMQTGSSIKKRQSTLSWGDIVDILPEDNKHILISSTPMSKSGEKLASILKLNSYTGVIRKKITKSPIALAKFITNISGKIKVVSGLDENNKQQLYIKKNRKWIKIPEDIFGTNYTPLSISYSGKDLYLLDNPNQDKTGIFKLDLDNYNYTEIFTDKNVDITDIEMSTDGRTAYALRVDNGYPAYLLLNKNNDEAKIFKQLLATFPNSEVKITSRTRDGKIYIVYVASDINPGQFYLYNREKNSLRFLFKYKDNLNTDELIKTEPFKFIAKDGTAINGYFTPAKSTSEIAPLVILVHGGPHARDYWGFSSQVQYLALNGYSVLQVNFRGSTGYGNNFKTAGYQEWGKKIQKDILEAYQWAVKNGKAQKNNSCIMGASFGGYSAIQSAAIYPDTYRCAIASAGVYDLELLFNDGDLQEKEWGESYLAMTLGTDAQVLKKNSPIYYADKIKIPILLAHGEKDERAPFEHAEKLKKALDKASKSYQWFGVDKEGHGFYNAENQKAYMQKVVKFLNKNLTKS